MYSYYSCFIQLLTFSSYPPPPPLPSQSPPQYVHHRMYLEPENPQKTREICLCFCCFFFHMHNYIHKRTNTHQAKKKKNRCVSDSPTDPSLNPPTLTFFFAILKNKNRKIMKNQGKRTQKDTDTSFHSSCCV